MLVHPKQFEFVDPKLTFFVKDSRGRFEITVSSKAFAKGAWLDLKTAGYVFTDNFFDLHGEGRTITVDRFTVSSDLTEWEFANERTVSSYYEMLGLQ